MNFFFPPFYKTQKKRNVMNKVLVFMLVVQNPYTFIKILRKFGEKCQLVWKKNQKKV